MMPRPWPDHILQSVTQPDGPTEFDLGKIIIDAAAEAGVQNLVYSSGADTETLTNGEIYCRMMMSMPPSFSPPQHQTTHTPCSQTKSKPLNTPKPAQNSPT
jgi:hypothetical protein